MQLLVFHAGDVATALAMMAGKLLCLTEPVDIDGPFKCPRNFAWALGSRIQLKMSITKLSYLYAMEARRLQGAYFCAPEDDAVEHLDSDHDLGKIGGRGGVHEQGTGGEGLNPGSTQVPTLGLDQRGGRPNINIKNLGSTQVQPRFNPGSTQVKPSLNPRSTQVQPRFEPRFEPRFNPGSNPGSNPSSTQVKPSLNPRSTQVQPRFEPRFEPRFNPGSNPGSNPSSTQV